MGLVLTPAHHRSAALLKVVTAFVQCVELDPAERKAVSASVLGKAKGVRLLVEAGTSTHTMAKQELDLLSLTVKGMSEVGDWPGFIEGYIEALRRVL